MLTRIALPIGLFLLWCFVCQHWYVCHIKQKCDDTFIPPPPPVNEPTEEAPDLRPLVFDWSKPDAITRSTFERYRNSILDSVPEGHILEIVGLYSEGEQTPDGFPNMGIARATKVKALLAEFLPPEQLLTSSRKVGEPTDARNRPFESIRFDTIEPTVEEKAEIVEVDDRVIIHFPFSQAVKEADPAVDAYLEKLAERLKQTTETVAITGHTDNVGNDKTNQRLGRSRARHVQDILISKGINKARITIASKGESDPISDNDSEAGRRKNRRAELVLNKAN